MSDIARKLAKLEQEWDRQNGPPTPEPPSHKTPTYILSIIFFGLFFYLFYNAGYSSGWTAFSWGVFSIVFLIAGVKTLRAARNADQKEAEDRSYRADAKQYDVVHQAASITLKHQEETAAKNRVIEDQKRVVESKILETQFNELRLRDQLIDVAGQHGLTPEAVVEVNKKKYLDELTLQNELRKMQEEVRLAIIAKHLSEVQKISLIQENIDGIIKQIDQIEKDNKLSEKTKQRLIAAREDIIQTFEEDRRGRQKRLVEAHHRGDIRGDDEEADL